MSKAPRVAIIMGSTSDWPTLSEAAGILDELGVSYDARVVSAHRTPDRLYDFAKGAKAEGFQCVIAGAGGAAMSFFAGVSLPCAILLVFHSALCVCVCVCRCRLVQLLSP